MVKASLLAVAVLTVLIAMGLRWRDNRLAMARPAPRAGLVERGKRTVNRWVTAAALATVTTLVLLGGLHWLRLASG